MYIYIYIIGPSIYISTYITYVCTCMYILTFPYLPHLTFLPHTYPVGGSGKKEKKRSLESEKPWIEKLFKTIPNLNLTYVYDAIATPPEGFRRGHGREGFEKEKERTRGSSESNNQKEKRKKKRPEENNSFPPPPRRSIAAQ